MIHHVVVASARPTAASDESQHMPQLQSLRAIMFRGMPPTIQSHRHHCGLVSLSNEHTIREPLICMHTPDGMCTLYRRLGSELAPEVVIGIEHRFIRTGDEQYISKKPVEETAIDYASLLCDFMSNKQLQTCHLGGASFGALLATATLQACLCHDEFTVRSIFLVDPPPPGLVAHRRLGRGLSDLSWRRLAAKTLLTRSVEQVRTAEHMSTKIEEGLGCFDELHSDEIDLLFAHRLAMLGLAPNESTAATLARRRLDAWVHSQHVMMLCQSSHLVKCLRHCSTLLVLSNERDNFFGRGPPLSEMSNEHFAIPIIVQGAHLDVMTRCCMGVEQNFRAALRAALGLVAK